MRQAEIYNSNSRSGGLGAGSGVESQKNPTPEGFVPRIIKSDASGVHIEQQVVPEESSSQGLKGLIKRVTTVVYLGRRA